MRKFLSALLLFLLACGVVSAQEEETAYEIALERIEEAQATNADTLIIGVRGLRELPPEIGSLSQLRYLTIAGADETSPEDHCFPYRPNLET
jgi:hypothetical protein